MAVTQKDQISRAVSQLLNEDEAVPLPAVRSETHKRQLMRRRDQKANRSEDNRRFALNHHLEGPQGG